MAESSGFFRSVGGDRKYTVDFLAEWVASFLSNGVYTDALAVTADANMQVLVPSGQAWINGYYYRSDADIPFQIRNADGVLNRKDTVVLRWDLNKRSISAQILTGAPASNPVAPAIVRTAEQYDLKLAEISVPAGTTAITQSLITDTRLDNNVCGIVHAVVDRIDTTTFYNQIAADLAEFKSTNESDFTAWFNGIKNILDENAAGNLLAKINDLAGDGRTTETVKANADTIAAHVAAVNPHGVTAAQAGAIPISASCNKNWNWSGQGGTPPWVWGGSDGSNMYVYSPANFNVNYANSAGSAPASGGTAADTQTISSALTMVSGGTAPSGTLSPGKLWVGY
ncbi:hypothetical protein A7X67_03325 [Clostridium sp. W14A]|nr:hypothetical protein A7X67_03325 [Clostridium sp. W14A]